MIQCPPKMSRLLHLRHRLPLARELVRNRRAFSSSSSHPQTVVAAATADFQEGQELCGRSWKVVRSQDVPEFGVRALELRHANSAAKFLHLSCDDEVNAFSCNFRTMPMESHGVSHILEHVVLCGSEKFPVRDPFFKMLNRSLSSYMNAMTWPDFTMYPFSTQNKKDFHNLLSVYLDAVFKPLLKEEDFRQEGWRLEQEDVEDPSSKLIIKGVVFNEMKGVFADPQQLFERHMLSLVLPSHTYGCCSGGMPEKIPELTWQQLRKFHEIHYSPHNARFYSYGNLDLLDQLNTVNKYLPTAKETTYQVPAVPSESRWTSPRKVQIHCAPDPSAPDLSTIALTYLACDINDSFETFVLQIVCELLIDGANAPFYKSLLESGLGSSYAPATGYECQLKDTFFTIGLQGVSEENKESVIKTVKDTFVSVCEEGFDQDRIEAILHRTELGMKNKSSNFGLGLIMALSPLWNHTGDDSPIRQLEINRKIAEFRRKMSENPKYLQEMARKYFVDNSHELTLVMTPKDSFPAEQQDVLDKIEVDFARGLGESDVKSLHQQAMELAKSQNLKQDNNCLPTLRVSDITDQAPRYDVKQLSLADVPVRLSAQPTNEVAFFRALLSTKTLPDELREILPLFTMVLSSLGAGKFDFRRLDTEIDLRTGGLSAGLHISELPSDVHILKEGILIGSHCLERNSDRMFELWTEIFNDLHHDNPERLKTLVSMIATSAMNGLVHRGHSYAMGSSASSIQPGCAIRENLEGMNCLKFLNQLAKRDDLDDVIVKLGAISKHLLTKSHMRVALNATPGYAETFVRQTQGFLTTIPGVGSSDGGLNYSETHFQDFRPEERKTYYSTPFPVHFCSTSLPAVPLQHEDFAPLRIMSRLLSLKYLHTEIREKGGAYGGGLAPNSSGVLSFYSYRDPNSHATLNVFDGSAKWLQETKFTEQDVDEAKLGVFQKIDEPVLPGSRGLREFLSDVTDDMLNKHRSELKAVTSEDVVRVGAKYLSGSVPRATTIIGPEPKDLDSSWTVKSLV